MVPNVVGYLGKKKKTDLFLIEPSNPSLSPSVRLLVAYAGKNKQNR